MSRRALFLDRDGVINEDSGYVYRRPDFVFIDGIFDLVEAAHKAGYLSIVVTNQAGIGRGLYGEDDFRSLMEWVKAQFVQRGSTLDAVYFCPNHPIHGLGAYRLDCFDRKPRPGMILKAARDHNIDLARSILVGDKVTDMEAAEAAGIQQRIFFSNDRDSGAASRVVRSLRQVIPLIDLQ